MSAIPSVEMDSPRLQTARLIDLAAQRSQSEQDIYDGVGASRQTFQNWKRRKYVPSNWHAALAQFLHCSVEEMLGVKPMTEPKDWPFKTLHLSRVQALSPGERLQLEGILLDAIIAIETERRSKRPRRLG